MHIHDCRTVLVDLCLNHDILFAAQISLHYYLLIDCYAKHVDATTCNYCNNGNNNNPDQEVSEGN